MSQGHGQVTKRSNEPQQRRTYFRADSPRRLNFPTHISLLADSLKGEWTYPWLRRDRSVYRLDSTRLGSTPDEGVTSSLFSIASTPVQRSTQPPFHWVPGALSPGVSGQSAKLISHLHLVAKWSYTSTPDTSSWRLIKHRAAQYMNCRPFVTHPHGVQTLAVYYLSLLFVEIIVPGRLVQR
jgi:hypothetical protein